MSQVYELCFQYGNEMVALFSTSDRPRMIQFVQFWKSMRGATFITLEAVDGETRRPLYRGKAIEFHSKFI